MRSLAAAALGFALAACGGGDGEEFAAGNSQITSAQVDAALGPADQADVQDGIVSENVEDGAEPTANGAASAQEEDEQ